MILLSERDKRCGYVLSWMVLVLISYYVVRKVDLPLTPALSLRERGKRSFSEIAEGEGVRTSWSSP